MSHWTWPAVRLGGMAAAVALLPWGAGFFAAAWWLVLTLAVDPSRDKPCSDT